MTNKKQIAALAFSLVWTFPFFGTAQESEMPQPETLYKPLVLELNEDGSKYVRFLIWNQIWATWTQNNPGTQDVNGKEIKSSTSLAIRRSRFLAYAQISPKFLILSHWGINNQSFMNGATPPNGTNSALAPANRGKKPQIFIHDAWTEYQVIKGKLYLGTGLHYWNGVSRFSSHSTLNFMATDAPIFNWFNIEATDQFARQFGFYAKGQLGRLDYRVHLNKPFVHGIIPTNNNTEENAVNAVTESWAPGAYFNWMFLEKESNKLPYFVGSYMGEKRVFNVGAGFYSHRDAMVSRRIGGLLFSDTTIMRHRQLCLGMDAFLDIPLRQSKGGALHAYLVHYNYNFGPGYLRNIGILNEHLDVIPGLSEGSSALGGNSQPTIGTGKIWFTQVGYAFPKKKNGTRFMPFGTLTHKNFERLPAPSLQYAVGINYFVVGHHGKITLEYQTRPVYRQQNDAVLRNGSKGQLILQTQIFL